MVHLVEKCFPSYNVQIAQANGELYKTSRAKQGAIVIEAKDETDVFDLPSTNLKKLVQGVIWRDEHFDGMALKDIALREKHVCHLFYERPLIPSR
jgi:hypothetical protein